MKKMLAILTAVSFTLACSLVLAPNETPSNELTKATAVKAKTDDPRG